MAPGLGQICAALMLTSKTAAVVVVSVIAGFGVMISVAAVTSAPGAILTVGLVGGLGVTAAGVRWLVCGVRNPFRRGRPGDRSPTVAAKVGASVAAVVVTAVMLGALHPADTGPRRESSVPGQQYWHLATGSTIRYTHIAAERPRRSDPVVFLHGGPGTPDLAGDTAYFGQLAADGFDVYVYDQFGAGGSSRAEHPRAYTRARDVADLEQIRRRIGADRINLIGHSYGAGLAAAYLAAYPQHVARVVFSSPVSLDPHDSSAGNLTSRLALTRRLRLYADVVRPRNLLAYALLQVNPEAAHRVAGDNEMDTRNDDVYALSEPALHCARRADPHPHPWTGFYRLQYPQSAAAPRETDLRPVLTGNPTPALVIKGACDYLSWGSALTYAHTLADCRLVYLDAAGHNAYQDQPSRFLHIVAAFLRGVALPVPPLRTDQAPKTYQGPR